MSFTTMQATGAGLLAAIIDEPDADDLRLIYADWLEDGVDEIDALQAAFIRKGMASPDEIRTVSFSRSVATVLVDGSALCDEITPFAMPLPMPSQANGYAAYSWQRGFVFGVICYIDDWVASGPRLVREQPITNIWVMDPQVTLRLDQSYVPAPTVASLRYRWQIRRTPAHTTILGDAINAMYDTEDEAKAFLELACLLWAKEQS